MQSRDHQLDDALKAKRREAEPGPRADPSKRLGWASALGNAAVQRLLRSVGLRRYSGGETVDDALARAIQAKRGTGQPLDAPVRREMEASLGHDLSDVGIHTNAEADALSQAVHADAFTTGRDIFFREGKYSPGSSEGRKLLAHELTHAVQQASAPPAGELTVSSPDDASERHASAVAEHVSASLSATGAPVGRQELPEEEEEKDEMQTSLERQAFPDLGGLLGGGGGGMPSLGGLLGGGGGGMPSLGGLLGGGALGGMGGMPSLGGLLGGATGGLPSLGGLLGGSPGGMGGMPSLGDLFGGLSGGMGGMPSLGGMLGGAAGGGGMPSLGDLFGGLTGGLMRAAPEEEEAMLPSLEREAIERIQEEDRVLL